VNFPAVSRCIKHFAAWLACLPLGMVAQEWYSIKGYVKELNSYFDANTSLFGPLAPIIPDNGWDFQIHNRVDATFFPAQGFSAGIGMRNRIFWGYQVKNNPLFEGFIGADPGWIDMSWVWMNTGSVMGHTTIDRAWIEYEAKRWEARVGRQRINWGINLLWNPHDLFNQFNFFDFDYEERPGSDAALVKYLINASQSLEVAAAVQNGGDSVVAAAMHKFRWRTADVQSLAGWFLSQPVVGTGWAANVKSVGWKMEMTAFLPFREAEGAFNLATGIDYLTKRGWFLQSYYLYNHRGALEANPLNFLLVGATAFSARNLYIYRHNLFFSAGRELLPLLRADVATIVSNDLEGWAVVPSLGYSALQDLEIYLLGQLFWGRVYGEFNYLNANAFLRFRYSF
jgi:hypothetical protein